MSCSLHILLLLLDCFVLLNIFMLYITELLFHYLVTHFIFILNIFSSFQFSARLSWQVVYQFFSSNL